MSHMNMNGAHQDYLPTYDLQVEPYYFGDGENYRFVRELSVEECPICHTTTEAGCDCYLEDSIGDPESCSDSSDDSDYDSSDYEEDS